MSLTQFYQDLLQEIKGLLTDSHHNQYAKSKRHWVTDLSNIASHLHYRLAEQGKDNNWTGFYLLFSDNPLELQLGPFQGKIACTIIPVNNKGVCATTFRTGKSIIVPNVHEWPGHIACDGLSQSEIVIPLKLNDKVVGLLDIDSIKLDSFDEHDRKGLEDIASWIMDNISPWASL